MQGNKLPKSELAQHLEEYANVLLKVGLNIQAGQRLLIGFPASGVYGVPIELSPLVRLIARKAYQAGARLVDVLWNDDKMRLIRFQEAPRDSFNEFPEWRANAAFVTVSSGDALLSLYAEDPELLKDQDPELVGLFQETNWQQIGPTMDLITKNAANWCVATAPVDGWVEKLFPGLSPSDGKAKFWDTLFEICRVQQRDPIAAWQTHLAQLSKRVDYLNHRKYSNLKYTGPGTDLMIGLPEGHAWHGGGMTSQNGVNFTANIPTEEVFTLPHKNRTNGVVTSTRPLGYGGCLVKELTLKFTDGRASQIDARENASVLQRLIETDEGASYLGEVALVPNSSPISQTGLHFGNILLDENASCHLALGTAYKFSIENGEALSDKEFLAIGGNQSMVHVDFMIGSGEMDVDGIRADHSQEPIMRGGEWAFSV